MKTILGLILLFASLNVRASYCPSSYSSCDFYVCAEERDPCGPNGYWMGWGHRICEKFLNKEEKFSLDAQQWMRENRECLQARAEEITAYAQCSSIRKAAMESHVACYVDTGFCELDLADKAAILWNLREAMTAPEAWIEGLNLNKACGARSAGSL
jgi:hypothetical protein